MGYLYILESNGKTKIGISRNKPTARVRQLQTGNPHRIKLVRYYRRQDYKQLEKKLHSQFSMFRVNGEWFNISPKLVIMTIEGTTMLGVIIRTVWTIILCITVVVVGSIIVGAYLNSKGVYLW